MLYVVFDKIDRLNRQCYNNFIRFNMAKPEERLCFTELKIIEEFRTRYRLSTLFNKTALRSIIDDELPITRALVGAQRTNLDFSEDSESVKPIFDAEDTQNSALHTTFEHIEKNSGLRFARTFFLSTLPRDEKYMEGVWFSRDLDHQSPNN